MTTVRYTLGETKPNVMSLARWVRTKMYAQTSASDCLTIARALLQGESWEPNYFSMRDPEDAGPCHVEIIREVHPDVMWFDQQQEYFKLAKQGAAGDANAAREFCQLVIDGKYLPGAAFAG